MQINIEHLYQFVKNLKMSKSSDKRQNLFEKFSFQLHEVINAGLYDVDLPHEKTFICPICLLPFSEKDLNVEVSNHLTLEDAPPISLGGTANTLTCKKCNNESGHEIDFHLLEFVNNGEIRSFQSGTTAKITVEHQGINVQGLLEIDEFGTITITHLKKNNNPEQLKSYIEQTPKGSTPVLSFKASRIDAKRFEVALLKTAYILAFAKYGYPLILSPVFDVVREQILNPDRDIHPSGFWTKQIVFTEKNVGVHLLKSAEMEGFMAIFMLSSKNGKKEGWGVYLPISNTKFKQAIENFKKVEAGDTLLFDSFQNTDYFKDNRNHKLCVDFIKMKNSI